MPCDNVCSNGDCVSQCLNSDQCNAGQYCEGAQGNTPGTCVDGCIEASCANGQICTDRECVTGCRNDDAYHVGTPASTISAYRCTRQSNFRCPGGQVCDRLNSRCVDCLQK